MSLVQSERSCDGEGGALQCALARALTVASIALILVWTSACARRKDAQSTFEHAMQSFRHGQVAQAQKEAEAGYKQFHTLSPEWAWKFRLLEADVLAWRGTNDRVLELLASESAPLPSGEITVQARRVQGSAYAALRRFKEAEQKFEEAEKLCLGRPSPNCTDIALEEGVMEMARGSSVSGRRRFLQALDLPENTDIVSRRPPHLSISVGQPCNWSALMRLSIGPTPHIVFPLA